jgi:hypothetical protein
MGDRAANIFLTTLLIAFLILFYWHRNYDEPEYAGNFFLANEPNNSIIANEYLILMEEGTSERVNEILEEFNLVLISPMDEWLHVAKKSSLNPQVIRLDSIEGEAQKDFVARLKAHEAIHNAELNYIYTPDTSCADLNAADDKALVLDPNDPLFRHQWYLHDQGGMKFESAWKISTGLSKVVVAVVDRSFNMNEKDIGPENCKNRNYFYENILDYFPENRATLPPDKTSHGSDVLSVLAPCTDNSFALSGPDWQAQVFAVDSKSDASLSARMFGILWAAGIDVCTSGITSCPQSMKFQKSLHPANIINASFGFAGPFLANPPYSVVLDVVGAVNRRGGTIVASAGNEKNIGDKRLPGAAGGVISVGATNKKQETASFSNFGRTLDVVAPGERILGLRNGKAVLLNGTSFSAPLVSGVVSLMLSVNPNLSWKHIEYILKKTANPMSCNSFCPASLGDKTESMCKKYCCVGQQNYCSSGIVNAFEAVKLASLGIPEVPLIDLDDYYIPLTENNSFRALLTIKNWGRQAAVVSLKDAHKNLKIFPTSIMLPAASAEGIPSYGNVTIYFDDIPSHSQKLEIILESSPGTDRIEGIADIVLDKDFRLK